MDAASVPRDPVDLSIVIGFRDWGLDRLALALRAHAASTYDRLEVVVSDYGSRDGDLVRAVTMEHGGRYVRTDTDGPWSRARALNAGVDGARGELIATTDSDLLFTPATASEIVERLRRDPQSVALVQCRNLEEGFGVEQIEAFDWEELERRSAYRPRWGMGGLIAMSRGAFDAVGGYDDRMEIYGGEDRDLAQRLQWAGSRHVWVDDPQVRIYHVWHPSTHAATKRDPQLHASVERNRAILTGDRTVVRSVRRTRPEPLATVTIATRDRAHMLEECLHSVFAQSVENFEVLVVDDGSEDGTAELLEEIADPRMRHLRQPAAGVAGARNRAIAEARAPYVVVHDDDDLMLPWRLEAHFAALTAGVAGTYGGWVDFDDETGDLTAYPGKRFSLGNVLYGSRVLLHPTLMLRRDLLQRVGYDERLPAGSDFNLALRLGAAGARLAHSGEFHIMRRQHGRNLTDTMPDAQRESARRTTAIYRRGFSSSEADELRRSARGAEPATCRGTDDLAATVGPYLPDRLVKRAVRVPGGDADAEAALVAGGTDVSRCYAVTEAGELARTSLLARGVSWSQLADLRGRGLDWEWVLDGDGGADPDDLLVGWLREAFQGAGAAAVGEVAPVGTTEAEAMWAAGAGDAALVGRGALQYVARAEPFASLEAALAELGRRAAQGQTHGALAFELSDGGSA